MVIFPFIKSLLYSKFYRVRRVTNTHGRIVLFGVDEK